MHAIEAARKPPATIAANRITAAADEGDRLAVAGPGGTGLPGAVEDDWRALATPTRPITVFEPGMADQLPPPAARWLRHAIQPGTPLRQVALLHMHGQIRTRRWLPFTAQQVLAPPRGFVWAATAGRWPLRIRGFDRYTRGTGELCWRVLGVVPVVAAAGDDVTRSAAGRLAAELVLVPGAALDSGISWEALDQRHATAHAAIGSVDHRVTIEVDDRGALCSLWLPRWGNPEGGVFAEHRFGVTFADEINLDGYTIPTTLCAGWGLGTDTWPSGVFFRATIDRARFQ